MTQAAATSLPTSRVPYAPTMPKVAGFNSFNPSPDWVLKGKRLGAWFRLCLSRSGKNINQLAKEAQVSTSYLYDIEADCWHGKEEPKQFKRVGEDVIRRIAAAMNVSPNDGLKAFGYDPDPRPAMTSVLEGLKPETIQLLSRAFEAEGLISLSGDVIPVPIIGQVSAGEGLLSPANVVEHIGIPKSLLKVGDDELFAVRVKGDCLIGLAIKDGDLLICRVAETANDGQVVVVTDETSDALAKRYRETERSRWVETVPMPPVPSDVVQLNGHARVVGVMVSLYRPAE